MNLPNFWYGSCFDGPLSENHTLYAGKILIWQNLVHLRPFFGQNRQFWEFLTYNFQTPQWIFILFGMEVVLMVFFEKSYSDAWEIQYVQNLIIFYQISALLWVFSLYLPKIVADLSAFFNFFEFRLFPGNQSYCVLLVWILFLWSSLRKSYSICRDKFWYGEVLAME